MREIGERRRWWAMLLLGAALLLATALIAPGSASAAEGEPTTTETTVPTTTGEETSSTGEEESSPSEEEEDSEEDGDDQLGLAIGILLLGAASLGVGYLFYDRWRASYKDLALATLKETHHFPNSTFNPTEMEQARGAVTVDEAQAQPVVTGPAAVVVGQANTYTAALNGKPLDSCNWTVEPEGAASVAPATGSTVVVTASKEGPFTLKAEAGGSSPTLVHVAAVPGEAKEGGIPLLGSNFAGLAAVLLAVSVAGSLAAADILGADAFIAFVGPIVGYFFAQVRNTSQSGAPAAGGSTGGTSSTS